MAVRTFWGEWETFGHLFYSLVELKYVVIFITSYSSVFHHYPCEYMSSVIKSLHPIVNYLSSSAL